MNSAEKMYDLVSELALLRKDAERWRWARGNAIVLEDFAYHIDDEVEELVDAQISAEKAVGAA